jgi:hypothetical protein
MQRVTYRKKISGFREFIPGPLESAGFATRWELRKSRIQGFNGPKMWRAQYLQKWSFLLYRLLNIRKQSHRYSSVHVSRRRESIHLDVNPFAWVSPDPTVFKISTITPAIKTSQTKNAMIQYNPHLISIRLFIRRTILSSQSSSSFFRNNGNTKAINMPKIKNGGNCHKNIYHLTC